MLWKPFRCGTAFVFCIFAALIKSMDQNEKNVQQNQINIELTDETADGIYSNLAIITHSNQEFVLDFIKVMPGIPKAKVKSRIILTPQHAKRFLKALSENVRKFESQYGEITDVDPINIPPMSFGGPTAQA
jgi:uncharacterized protein (DUF1778 family)